MLLARAGRRRERERVRHAAPRRPGGRAARAAVEQVGGAAGVDRGAGIGPGKAAVKPTRWQWGEGEGSGWDQQIGGQRQH